MKSYAKLSALGAVLVMSAAFASADTVTIASNINTMYTGYNSNPLNSTPTKNAGTNAFALNNVTPTWTAAGTGSSWISWDPNSGPSGGESAGSCTSLPCSTYDADGTYTYKITFTTTGGYYSGSIGVMADDTTDVILNGTDVLLSEGSIGNDGHCSDGQPSCTTPTYVTLNSSLAGFNSDGVNTLWFVVEQTGTTYQGLDVFGSITTTPEPNTLVLLGTGLLGSAGALFRKMRSV
jgi:PEP-CTERM motif